MWVRLGYVALCLCLTGVNAHAQARHNAGGAPEAALAQLVHEEGIASIWWGLRSMGSHEFTASDRCLAQVHQVGQPAFGEMFSCLKRNGYELQVESPEDCTIKIGWKTPPLYVQRAWDGSMKGTYVIGASVVLPLTKLAEDRFGEGGSSIIFDFGGGSELGVTIITTSSGGDGTEYKWREAYPNFRAIPDLDSGGLLHGGNGFWPHFLRVGPIAMLAEPIVHHGRFVKVELPHRRERKEAQVSVPKISIGQVRPGA